MPRKEKSPAEVFIAFCMTATKEELEQLLGTAAVIVATRFNGTATVKVRKSRAAKPPAGQPATVTQLGPREVAASPAPVAGAPPQGRIQEEAAARSPRRRGRPPVGVPNGVPPATAAGVATPADAAAGDTLPPQDSPLDTGFDN